MFSATVMSRHDGNFLRQQPHAGRDRRPRIGEDDLFAVDLHGAGVARVDAGQDLHERRLARAVRAEQRHHLAGLRRRGRRRSSTATPPKDLPMPRISRRGVSRMEDAEGTRHGANALRRSTCVRMGRGPKALALPLSPSLGRDQIERSPPSPATCRISARCSTNFSCGKLSSMPSSSAHLKSG